MNQYVCLECNRRGVTEGGKCPACGSENICSTVADRELLSVPFRVIAVSIALVIGFVVGVSTFVIAIELAMAGHGWAIPGVFSWMNVITMPLTLTGLARRKTRAVWRLACILVAVAVITDCFAYYFYIRDNTGTFPKVWAGYPGLVITWAVLFFSQQICAFFLMYYTDVHAGRGMR
jgi:hypothetical protein